MKKVAKRVRRIYTLLAEAVLALLLLAGVGPVLVALPLRWFQPPTTAFYLTRAAERAWAGTKPALPYRVCVGGESLPRTLRRAVVAAEDQRFYLHNGFDLRQIADALDDYDRGKQLRGASTISQQTAKNLFLWEGRSWVRKGLEVYCTFVLEKILPKDRILEIYLDTAEWGEGVFGAEAAARYYFRKSAADLSPWEAARLAAILPNPREWHPNTGRAAARAQVILRRMNGIPEPRR